MSALAAIRDAFGTEADDYGGILFGASLGLELKFIEFLHFESQF